MVELKHFYRNILAPLSETFDTFWINNEDPNQEWNAVGHVNSDGEFENYNYYYNAELLKTEPKRPVQYDTAFDSERSFVCEREVE